MLQVLNDNDFNSSPILLVSDNNNQKTLSMPIKNKQRIRKHVSKSWGENTGETKCDKRNFSISPNDLAYLKRCNENMVTDIYHIDFKPYDAINNCKSAGIIPYTIHNGIIYFLFQQAKNPLRKKDSGWNDFGGKRISQTETTAEAAAREFSEETSCLFYLKENQQNPSNYYNLLKNNDNLVYDDETITILKNLITKSQQYFSEKINEVVLPVYISSKETYISYFLRVKYIPEEDLPQAEDIHIPYEVRYLRTCKWFSYEELMELDEKDFHKRLQITRIQQRIQNYYEKGLFT